MGSRPEKHMDSDYKPNLVSSSVAHLRPGQNSTLAVSMEHVTGQVQDVIRSKVQTEVWAQMDACLWREVQEQTWEVVDRLIDELDDKIWMNMMNLVNKGATR